MVLLISSLLDLLANCWLLDSNDVNNKNDAVVEMDQEAREPAEEDIMGTFSKMAMYMIGPGTPLLCASLGALDQGSEIRINPHQSRPR
ncbi:uncharacterized protein LOC141559698 isoform X3 [Sminthopsis crassicaudata]|uniref:uncharacterized protein LOC141559698 isoform X3 n=1 Tax=Sminthopsis crassicaudata TaxID=9301 RepID=UPI003D686272